MVSSMKNSKYILMGLAAILVIQVSSIIWSTVNKPTDVVYIDNDRLLDNYQGMIDAREDFEAKQLVWRANIDTLTMGVTKAIQDFEKSSAQLSKDEQVRSKALIKNKQLQLQQYQQAIQQQAQQADEEMTTLVLTQVNTFLSAYGEANDFKVIMGANHSGNILYAQSDLDITDQVLEELNQKYTGR